MVTLILIFGGVFIAALIVEWLLERYVERKRTDRERR